MYETTEGWIVDCPWCYESIRHNYKYLSPTRQEVMAAYTWHNDKEHPTLITAVCNICHDLYRYAVRPLDGWEYTHVDHLADMRHLLSVHRGLAEIYHAQDYARVSKTPIANRSSYIRRTFPRKVANTISGVEDFENFEDYVRLVEKSEVFTPRVVANLFIKHVVR